MNLRDGAKKTHRFIDSEIEHIRNVQAFVIDFEGFAIVTPAIAGFARNIHRRQKVHLDFDQAIAFALLATASLDVETEPARFITANARRRQFREQVTNLIEHSRVSRRIAARCPANRRLIDDDDFVQIFETFEGAMRPRTLLRPKKLSKQRATENVIDERALSGAAHAGNTSQSAERNPGVDVLQIVFGRAQNFEPAPIVRWFYAGARHGNGQLATEVSGGERGWMRQHLGQRAGRHQFSSPDSRARAKIENNG